MLWQCAALAQKWQTACAVDRLLDSPQDSLSAPGKAVAGLDDTAALVYTVDLAHSHLVAAHIVVRKVKILRAE